MIRTMGRIPVAVSTGASAWPGDGMTVEGMFRFEQARKTRAAARDVRGISEEPMFLHPAEPTIEARRSGLAADFDESDLHGFADGTLAPRDRQRVAVYLANHPEQAARAEAYRRQNIGLCLLYGATPLPRFPDRALDTARRAAAIHSARTHRLLWALAALFGAILAAGGGLWLYE
jgi:hypothetical protein